MKKMNHFAGSVCAVIATTLMLPGAAWADAPAADAASPVVAPSAEPVSGGREPAVTSLPGGPVRKTYDGILGDWGGLREKLDDAGVGLTVAYGNEFAANVAGGARKDATAVGQLVLGTDLDMDKIAGIHGGSFHGKITYRHGPNLGDKAGLETLQLVQEVWGRGQTWRVTEAYYQQQIGASLDVKIGRMTMGSDFEQMGCEFQNLSFCGAAVGNLVGDYWYNWPISQWALVANYKHKSWYVKAAVFEANRHSLDNNFAFNHGGADGVTVPVEAGWTPHLGSRGLPGVYKIGAWYNSQRADDVLLGVDGQPVGARDIDPMARRGRYGGYIAIRQQITGSYTKDPLTGAMVTRGVSVQFNLTQTDRRTARTDNQLTAGLLWSAPFAARPHDELGWAIGRTNVNGRAAYGEQLASPTGRHADAEYLTEFYYGVHVYPGVMLKPNIQYIVNPGGYHTNKDVVILGMKSSFAL